MAKISDLPALAAPTGAETVVVVDGAVTKRAALGPIVAAAAAPSVAAAAASERASAQNLQLVTATKAALDQAVAGGKALGVVINGAGLVFETIGVAQLATIPAGTKLLRTMGFYAASDGGGGEYRPVAADPGIGAGAFRSADGQWWKLIDLAGVAYVRQFGAKGDGVANDWQAFLDALAFLTVTPGYKAWAMAAEIRLGFGKFYVGGQTWEGHKRVRLVGMSNGYMPAGQGDVTQMIWDAGVCSIRINTAGTHGTTSVPFESRGGSAGGSLIYGIGIVQKNTGFVAGAHGIDVRGDASIERCTFAGIGDTAIYSITTAGSGGATEGGSNRSLIRDVFVHTGFGDGLNIGGADSNCWLVENFNTHQLAGCGIINTPYFVNTFVNCLINGYGNGGVAYNGRGYCLIAPGQGRVEPGTNNEIWYDLGPLASTTDTQYPVWQPNTNYRLQLPVYSPGSASEFRGLYAESQRNVAHIGGPVTGTIVCTSYSGGWQQQSNSTDIGKGGIDLQRGIGTMVRGLIGAQSAFMGSSAWAYVGTRIREGVHVLEFGRASEGGGWRWDQLGDSGFDQDFGYSGSRPTFRVTGVNTTQTFGGPATRPRIFGVSDLGLYNWQDGYHSLFGARATTPQGPVGQGSYYLNQDARAGNHLLWRVLTGGIAGSTAVIEKVGGTTIA